MAEHEDVAELVLGVEDVVEELVTAILSAEGAPFREVRARGFPGFRDGGFGGSRERRAEVSLEASLAGSWSSRQGFDCGKCCSK